MTPEEIYEQALADCAMLPPHVLPTQAWITGHPSTLPRDSIREEIARHANTDFPREACGFVLSTGAVVHCTNVADDPINTFQVDPVEAEAWWATGLIASVWHSHPSGPAVPSEADVHQAVDAVATLIYSVEDEDLGIYSKQGDELVLLGMEGPE